MKAISLCFSDGLSQPLHRAQRTAPDPSLEAETALLEEIYRLGGEERRKGVAGALDTFENALSQLVAAKPKAYGADEDRVSQRRVMADMVKSVRTAFLTRTIAELRKQAGYVSVLGCWIHRAVFTFVIFGLVAALVLPLCVVSLMSAMPWGWLPGVVGIIAVPGAGVWILSRIRCK
jgi:hypothetical protein